MSVTCVTIIFHSFETSYLSNYRMTSTCHSWSTYNSLLLGLLLLFKSICVQLWLRNCWCYLYLGVYTVLQRSFVLSLKDRWLHIICSHPHLISHFGRLNQLLIMLSNYSKIYMLCFNSTFCYTHSKVHLIFQILLNQIST